MRSKCVGSVYIKSGTRASRNLAPYLFVVPMIVMVPSKQLSKYEEWGSSSFTLLVRRFHVQESVY
jgi:hypothetical protein